MDTPVTETGAAVARRLESLSRFLHPADYEALAPELRIVDERWDGTQHEARRWEYALALRAIDTHYPGTPWAPRVVDVGGAGSPFWRMVGDLTSNIPDVVDPASGGPDLAGYLTKRPHLANAVTCLSVLEHVPDEGQFLYHLGCLVAPGGVLVLTMDAVGDEAVQDTYHFHWMRQRIYTPERLAGVLAQLAPLGLVPESPPNFLYPGPQVYDYSFVSLVCRKRA